MTTMTYPIGAAGIYSQVRLWLAGQHPRALLLPPLPYPHTVPCTVEVMIMQMCNIVMILTAPLSSLCLAQALLPNFQDTLGTVANDLDQVGIVRGSFTRALGQISMTTVGDKACWAQWSKQCGPCGHTLGPKLGLSCALFQACCRQCKADQAIRRLSHEATALPCPAITKSSPWCVLLFPVGLQQASSRRVLISDHWAGCRSQLHHCPCHPPEQYCECKEKGMWRLIMVLSNTLMACRAGVMVARQEGWRMDVPGLTVVRQSCV